MDSKSDGPAVTGKGGIFGATGDATRTVFGHSGLRAGFGKGISSVATDGETKATDDEISWSPAFLSR